MTLHAALTEQLAELERLGLTRQRRTLEAPCGPLAQVDGQNVISFCSNDYLGLAKDPALIEAACAGAKIWGVGSGASHLVSGHQTPHDALERRLASFTGFARALFFSTGYMANLGLITALAGREAAIFADKLNHASLIDAVQLSRAQSRRYPHGDLAKLEALLANSTAKQKLIVTDAVFSMDGDLAPLPELLALAERFNAWLVIDDAHGFGVLGAQGRGSLAHFSLPPSDRLVYMGTLGKAAGGSGAFVAGSHALIEWLVQRARTYMFSTGSSPMIACALLTSLDLIESGDERRHHLQQLIAQLQNGLSPALNPSWSLLPSPTAIQALVIGDNREALRLADALYQRGLWVPAIRPPSVPEGRARLRISLSAAHKPEQVAALIEALRELA